MLLLITPAAHGEDFHLLCLGCSGGDFDSDLTSFLLRPADLDTWSVMLDGGSVASGILKWQENIGTKVGEMNPEEKIKLIGQHLMPVEGMLLTHSHLDHVSGFSILGPLFLNLNAQWKKPSFRLLASHATIDQLEKFLYSGKIWGNFGHFPKGNTILAYERTATEETKLLGGIKATRYPVEHKVESSTWLIENKVGNQMLFFGDTGTLPVTFWKKFQPLIEKQTLKGLIMEVSFPVAAHSLATRTTHLTRDTLLLSLANLVGIYDSPPLPLTDEMVNTLSKKVAKKLTIPVMVVHIKPWEYTIVIEELNKLKENGIAILVAEQGLCYSF
jgi:cAMP phosphodiesterase